MSEPFQIPLENRVQDSGGILRFARFEPTGSDPFQIWMECNGMGCHLGDVDDLTPNERFLGLPDNIEEQQRVLKMVLKLDPAARIHPCSPPTGALLEVHNVQAMVLARMIIDGFRPNKFEMKKGK